MAVSRKFSISLRMNAEGVKISQTGSMSNVDITNASEDELTTLASNVADSVGIK